MNVSYVSACFDASGYAEAARNNICALSDNGVAVQVVPVSFETFKSDLGIVGTKVKNLLVKESNAKIQIIHTTPNIFHRFHNPNKYNIGYTTWETTSLPKGWAESINTMNEVWVPCELNVSIFRNSGVTIPIHVIPHTFSKDTFDTDQPEMNIQNLNEDDFIFYSIFQWTVRKNPVDLLKAYLTEFTPEDKTCLLLKTYIVNPNNSEERDKLRQMILEVKQNLHMDLYPKVILVTSLLSRSQIAQLHRRSHCYLSFHRNEGFGIPVAEAMLMGKPVICTNYGGTTDFVTNETGYPISYQETPVYGMPWETYKGNQVWADINVMEARKAMRHVHQNRDEAKSKGIKGQQVILDRYSWPVVANKMKARLQEIENNHVR